MDFIECVKADNAYIELGIRNKINHLTDTVMTDVDRALGFDGEVLSTYMSKSGRGIGGSIVLRAAQLYEVVYDQQDSQPFVVDLAATVELVNGAILMIDDVVDSSQLRKNAPTAHKQYESRVLNPHLAEGQAVQLASIVLLHSFNQLRPESENESIAKRVFSQSAMRTLAGNMFESRVASDESLQCLDSILSVYRNKTSNYSFGGPLEAGLAIAGTSDEDRQTFRVVSGKLGCSFQVLDDLEGLFCTNEVSGKVRGDDIKEKIHSFAHHTALQVAGPAARDKLVNIYETEQPSDQDVAAYVDVLRERSIDKILADLVRQDSDKTAEHIKKIWRADWSPDLARYLFSMTDFMLGRADRYT